MTRPHLLKDDRHGRIPFAFLALILLILTSYMGVSRMAVNDIQRSAMFEKESNDLDEALYRLDNQLEERAYYYTMEIIKNVTGQVNPDLSQVQKLLDQKMDDYIDEHFPVKTQTYTIYITDYQFKVSTEIMDNYDAVLSPGRKRQEESRYYTSMLEVNTKTRFDLDLTRTAFYPRIVGYVDYRATDIRRGTTVEDTIHIDKNIYVPLPLIKRGVDSMRFSFRDDRGYASVMVRYILTTLGQYRILMGVGGGGYDDNLYNEGLDQIITQNDVELAVNIALILEMSRNFRDYDIDIAKAIDNRGYPGGGMGHSMETLIRNYVNNGTVDAADILALFYGYDDTSQHPLDVGKVMAQAIYAYADRFVYEMYDYIWGHDASDQYHLVDPTLQNPIENWNAVRSKGEDWAKQMVYIWLNKFREWLGIPAKLSEYQASAYIQPMTVYYARPPNPEIGDPGASGTYYVFGGSGTPNAEYHGGNWNVKFNAVDDTVYLIMGDPNSNVNTQTGQSMMMATKPVKITCSDDFNSGVGEKTYEYYLVKDSYIHKHSDNPGMAYQDTLEYIIKSLDKSMKQRRSQYGDDIRNAGLADYIADQADKMTVPQPNIYIHPDDQGTILYSTTKELLYDTDGNDDSYYHFLKEMGQNAGDLSVRDQWFHDGAYHYGQDETGKKDPDFLYALVKDTVDLWYEMVLNLYWGGIEWDIPVNPQLTPPTPIDLPPEKQIADGQTGPQNRDFKFREDAMEDLWYRIHKDIWQHGMEASDRRNVWDESHWIGYPKPADPVTIEAVLALAKAQWSDMIIWNSLLNNPQWSDGIKDALDKTVGEEGLEKPDNNEITEALKDHMDTTTDDGQYTEWEGFYNFVANTLGVPVFIRSGSSNYDPEDHHNLITMLTDFVPDNPAESGWLDRSVREAMFYGIYDHADLWNTEYVSPSLKGTPYRVWHGNEADCTLNGSILSEGLDVKLEGNDGTPKLLDLAGTEIDEINIEYERHNHRHADVQNEILKDANGDNYYLAEAPFERQWNISVKGRFDFTVSTLRKCLIYDGLHEPLQYRAEIDIDMRFQIQLYSAWPLQSSWDSNDGNYYYTREEFGLVGNGERFDHPHFINKPFNEFNYAVKTLADTAVDSEYVSAPLLTSVTDIGTEKNMAIPTKFGYMDVDEIRSAYEDFMTNYINEIINDFTTVRSQVPSPPSGYYEYSFYGYRAQVPIGDTRIKIWEENPSTGENRFEYMITLSGGQANINAKLRSQDFTYNYTIEPQTMTYHYEAGYDLNGNTVGGGKFVFTMDYHQNMPADQIDFDPIVSVGDVYLEKYGQRRDLNIGFIHNGMTRQILDDALDQPRGSINNSEALIDYLVRVLGYLYNDTYIQQLASYHTFGFCIEIEDFLIDWNLRCSPVLHTQNGGSIGDKLMKYYLKWMIDNMRHIVYNLGLPEMEQYLLAEADGEYDDLWKDCGLWTDLYNNNASSENHGDGALYYCNLVSTTMAVNEFGFQPEDIYIEMSAYKPSKGYWDVKVS